MTPAAGDMAAPADPPDESPSATIAEAPPEDPLLPPFEQVCDRLAGFDETLDPFHIDGFLTAVATAARPIPVDEWLEALCGDTFERVFADPEDAAQARRALQDWAARIRDELDPERLMDAPDEIHIAPFLDDWTDEDRAALIEQGVPPEEAASLRTGAAWREGFFAALDAFPGDWPSPEGVPRDAEGEAYRALLETIGWIDADLADPAFLRFAATQWKGEPPTRDELITEACFAVQDLRLYGIDHAPSHPPRRVEKMPGRNDPCPCGSGRKFKKCHGA